MSRFFRTLLLFVYPHCLMTRTQDISSRSAPTPYTSFPPPSPTQHPEAVTAPRQGIFWFSALFSVLSYEQRHKLNMLRGCCSTLWPINQQDAVKCCIQSTSALNIGTRHLITSAVAEQVLHFFSYMPFGLIQVRITLSVASVCLADADTA